MVDYKMRQLRADQFRRWYYRLPSANRRSAIKNKLMESMQISEGVFYKLLRGYTYINPFRCQQIEKAIGEDIFMKRELNTLEQK